jgi:hypothetical protein
VDGQNQVPAKGRLEASQLLDNDRVLKRLFDLSREHCPNYGGEVEIIAAILERPVIEETLTHLGLQALAPPRHPRTLPPTRVASHYRAAPLEVGA